MLDITRLERVRQSGAKIIARCPACAAEGGDKNGNHLFMNPETGAFGCAAHPGDNEHRREIFKLAGITTTPDPACKREWIKEIAHRNREDAKRRKLAGAARAIRESIIQRHIWTPAEVSADSPEKRPDVLTDPRLFISSLFRPDDVVWTGKVYDSGMESHAVRWNTAEAWQAAPRSSCGPMVSPAVWKPGTISRSALNVKAAPFLVLDFDGIDGIRPATPEQLRAHIGASLAIVRWLREALEWRLAALLWTGGKSIHAWFRTPLVAAVASLRDIAPEFGIDAGLLGNPEHPARLPGWKHAKTGRLSEVLWMETQTAPMPF
jgi:hypothetical protein